MQRSAEELAAGLDHVMASPRGGGRLEAIVVRPRPNERLLLNSCRLDPVGGAEGDRWVTGFPSPPHAGSPDQHSQVTLMNARAAELVAGSRERWGLAGDQLYVDYDLADDHLRAGDRLRIGEAVLEITPKPHNGCRKFEARYGSAALAWVNSAEGRRLHLRGIYARVVSAGVVRCGDPVERIGPADAEQAGP